jgi:peptidoglycan/LPS O-acetylase OafA/YrhL
MRFARIMPCLFALILISIPLDLMNANGFVIQNTSLWQTIFSALTFQINRLVANVGYPFPANWDVLWSLSVEEVFYLFFPVCCILLRRQKLLIAFMLMFIVIGPFARTQFTDNEIWSDHSYLSCMDGIAIGCLAALFANKLRSRFTLISLLISGLILFSAVFFFRKLVFNLGISSLGLNVTILEIGIACILIASQRLNFLRLAWVPKFNFIQWFGRNSYEIYLTHSFIVVLAANILYSSNQPTWLISIEYLMIVLISGLLGQTIAAYYSEPLNQQLRNNFSIRKLAMNNNG